MLAAGASTVAVAAQVGVSEQAICSLRRRFGRLKLPTTCCEVVDRRRDDTRLRPLYLQNRSLTPTETHSVTHGTHSAQISPQTVRNRLVTNGLYIRTLSDLISNSSPTKCSVGPRPQYLDKAELADDSLLRQVQICTLSVKSIAAYCRRICLGVEVL